MWRVLRRGSQTSRPTCGVTERHSTTGRPALLSFNADGRVRLVLYEVKRTVARCWVSSDSALPRRAHVAGRIGARSVHEVTRGCGSLLWRVRAACQPSPTS